MDKQFFLDAAGIPPHLQFDQPPMPTWHSLSELHFPVAAAAAHSSDGFFESALSSMVASPATASNGSFVIRELIGKLGNICNSGEISPPENHPPATEASSPFNSGYNTPLSSPPKMNFMTNPGLPIGSGLDPGFSDRAARFSSFGSRSFNGRTSQFAGQPESELPSNPTRLAGGGKLQRVSSSPSINEGYMAENGHCSSSSPRVGSQNYEKTGRFSGNSSRAQGEFGNSMDDFSGTDQTNPVAENGSRLGNDMNPSSRKRKYVPKGKCKEIPSPPPPKVIESRDDRNAKRSKLNDENVEADSEEGANDSKKQNGNSSSEKQPEPLKDYIHVRARRGQATDSHSLAERVRREKIGERMKLLQDLVPGCNKVTGKALMLEEIINYVQSLQRQVEFLSMKLSTVNPRLDFDTDNIFQKDIYPSNCSMQTHQDYPLDALAPNPYGGHQQPPNPLQQNGITTSGLGPPCSGPMGPLNQCHYLRLPSIDAFNNGVPELCEGDLHTLVQMGFGQSHAFSVSDQDPAMKTEF